MTLSRFQLSTVWAQSSVSMSVCQYVYMSPGLQMDTGILNSRPVTPDIPHSLVASLRLPCVPVIRTHTGTGTGTAVPLTCRPLLPYCIHTYVRHTSAWLLISGTIDSQLLISLIRTAETIT